MEIKDNFLDKDIFDDVFKIITSNGFPWYTVDNVNPASKDDDFQFLHTLIENGEVNSDYIDIVNKVCSPLDKVIVTRARVNLFTKTEKQKGLGFHIDRPNSKTLLLYLEDSNGYTEFKTGEKIKSVSNRAVIFNSEDLHQTVNQTDVNFRRNININFNYA
jgi:hypothetical protein